MVRTSDFACYRPFSMMLTGVILDMDGLMLDTESIAKTAWQGAGATLGYPLDDAFFMTLLGRRDLECDAELVARFGTAFPLSDFHRRASHAWTELVERCGIATKPGLDELLTLCDERRLPVAIATSSYEDRALMKLRVSGLENRFGTIVAGDQVERGKPEPDIFLEAARRLGVAAHQCVVLEDSDAGVLAARAAGMIPLLVPDLGRTPSQQACEAAYRVLGSLHDAAQLIGGWLDRTEYPRPP